MKKQILFIAVLFIALSTVLCAHHKTYTATASVEATNISLASDKSETLSPKYIGLQPEEV